MKKIHIVLLAIFCAALCGQCIFNFLHISEFALSSYNSEIKHYEEEHIDDPPIVLGPIESRRDVLKKAESILIETYGKDTIKGEKPFKLGYDSLNEVWLIEGRWWHLPGVKGGVAYILIRDCDGEVLAMWHEC